MLISYEDMAAAAGRSSTDRPCPAPPADQQQASPRSPGHTTTCIRQRWSWCAASHAAILCRRPHRLHLPATARLAMSCCTQPPDCSHIGSIMLAVPLLLQPALSHNTIHDTTGVMAGVAAALYGSADIGAAGFADTSTAASRVLLLIRLLHPQQAWPLPPQQGRALLSSSRVKVSQTEDAHLVPRQLQAGDPHSPGRGEGHQQPCRCAWHSFMHQVYPLYLLWERVCL